MADPSQRKVTSSACLTIFPSRRETQRTVCLVGVPRGGTSMVSGILRKLGVFMGEDIDPANSEDREFLKHQGRREIFQDPAFARERSAYISDALKLVEKRNASHDLWGWKDPISPYYIREMFVKLRNPVFIFITRDPAAIAQREKIEEGITTRRRLLGYMNVTLDAYKQCIDIVSARARPTLLISYERALRYPREVGGAIQELVGVSAPPDFEGWIERYILPDRLDGSINDLTTGEVKAKQFGSSVSADVFVNESLRLQREGLLSHLDASQDPYVQADMLYVEASKLLSDGDFELAQSNALGIVGLFVPRFPELSDGPLGYFAQELAGGGGQVIYPDVVAGAFFLIGLSNLLRTSAQRAIIYFTIAERMMRDRISKTDEVSVLSNANYLSCLFHLGMSAAVMQKVEMLSEICNALLRGEARYYLAAAQFQNSSEWVRRARSELSVKSVSN